MVKLSNKVSYISIFVILFVLIAIFFIARNIYLLTNSIPVEAVCYKYEKTSDKYNVSYLYKYKNDTYYITNIEENKPILSSKKEIFCNKKNIKKCVVDKNIYLKQIYISILAIIPMIFFIVIYIIKKPKNNVYHK